MKLLIGCSGWSYSDSFEKGGWLKVFYPSSQTKKLEYYAQFFDTVELDATFYEKFYKYMTKDTFRTMTKVTPDNFQFSIKVPEIVTHDKRLDVKSGAVTDLDGDAGAIRVQFRPERVGFVEIERLICVVVRSEHVPRFTS